MTAGIKAFIIVMFCLSGMILKIIFLAIIGSTNCTKHKQAVTSMRKLGQAIEEHKIDTGQYPQKLEDLSVDPLNQDWLGPYIKDKDIKDPWGHAYRYVVLEQTGQILIYHLGANGLVGGTSAYRDGFLLLSPIGTHEYIEPAWLR